ncbi:esterase, partial [Methylobacterium radiotolerans]
MVIRSVFTKGGERDRGGDDEACPGHCARRAEGRRYGDAGADTTMDVFRPASADGALPTVVWIHGGA